MLDRVGVFVFYASSTKSLRLRPVSGVRGRPGDGQPGEPQGDDGAGPGVSGGPEAAEQSAGGWLAAEDSREGVGAVPRRDQHAGAERAAADAGAGDRKR